MLISRRSVALTVVCAIMIFMASADLLFAIRTGVGNLRFGAVALLIAFVVFAATRWRRSHADVKTVTIAWSPFIAVYALAVAISPTPAPGLLKLAWFTFDFVVAFAAIALFGARNAARGYFLCYLVIASIIVIDFVNGFTHGPGRMIGYGQANDMVPGLTLFRPHAFYYEPSYAASSLALAWALAMTKMRDVAPRLATVLVAVGAVAIVLMTSRTGWMYAAVAAAAVLAYRCWEGTLRLSSLARAAIPFVLFAGALAGLVAFSDKREAFGGLLARLGFAHAFERMCPLVTEQFAVDLACLPSDARRMYFGEGQTLDAEETTEGIRVVALRTAAAVIAEHPWLGVGVAYGEGRVIAPPKPTGIWLEIAREGGLLSLLAFTFGMTFTAWRWGMFEARHRDIMIVVVLWLLIVWQFIQTFPRLDLWIAFWVVLAWTRDSSLVAPRVETGMIPAAAAS